MPRPSLTRFFALHRLDKATAAFGDARAKLANAETAYQAADLRPIREELAIADAKLKNAEAAVARIAARAAKLRISAPENGTVGLLVAERECRTALLPFLHLIPMFQLPRGRW